MFGDRGRPSRYSADAGGEGGGGDGHAGIFRSPAPASVSTPTRLSDAPSPNSNRNTRFDGKTTPPIVGLFTTPDFRMRSPGQAGAMTAGSATATPTTTRATTSPPLWSSVKSQFSNTIRQDILRSGRSNDEEERKWVTVFGFPLTASNFILLEFSKCGTILHHDIPRNGNWMHIKYQTSMQAQIALGKNGCILGRKMMIGVCPCMESKLVERLTHQQTESIDVARAGTLNPPPPAASELSLDEALRRGSIRSLARACKEPAVDEPAVTPNRNGSLIDRALEYVFGL